MWHPIFFLSIFVTVNVFALSPTLCRSREGVLRTAEITHALGRVYGAENGEDQASLMKVRDTVCVCVYMCATCVWDFLFFVF